MPAGEASPTFRFRAGRMGFRLGSGWRSRCSPSRSPTRRRRRYGHDSSRRRLSQISKSAMEIQRFARMRLRARLRAATPGAFLYPRTENTDAACWLKNRVAPRVEDKCCVSGVRGAGRGRAAQGTARIFHRPPWRRLSQFRDCARCGRRGLHAACDGREQMPRMDLCAAGLYFAARRAVISRTGSRGHGKSHAAFRASVR